MGSGRDPPHLVPWAPGMSPRAFLSPLPSPTALLISSFHGGSAACPHACVFSVETTAPNQTLKEDCLALCGARG